MTYTETKMIPTLDLHGIKHQDVKVTVENFILANGSPLKIITGNSPHMKSLVFEVLRNHGFKYTNLNDYNLGEYLIYD